MLSSLAVLCVNSASGPQGNQLIGIDSDHNGVRDTIDSKIDTLATTKIEKQVITQLAKTIQSQVTYGQTGTKHFPTDICR